MTDNQEIKKMSAREFRELGYLREVNRQVLHPLGLALEIIEDEDTGELNFGEVWDFRHDPEGMFYQDDIVTKPQAIADVDRIVREAADKASVRIRKFGYVIQPIGNDDSPFLGKAKHIKGGEYGVTDDYVSVLDSMTELAEKAGRVIGMLQAEGIDEGLAETGELLGQVVTHGVVAAELAYHIRKEQV